MRSVTAMASGGVLLLALSACSVPGFGPDADQAVQDLASAMASGDVKGVAFVGGDKATVFKDLTAEVSATLKDAEVSAGKVTTDGDVATGTLDWRWKVGTRTWSYDTTVKLAKGQGPDGDAWLVRWSPKIVEPSLKTGQRLFQQTIKPRRGKILGAGDKPIVALRPVVRVGIDKANAKPAQLATSARALARLVDVDAKAFLKQVRATGRRAFVQAIVYRRDDAPEAVLSGLKAIPGAGAISDRVPLAPTKDFAAAILGTVGPATAEIVKESKGRIRAGDDVGLSGLQKRYDAQLAGTRGTRILATLPTPGGSGPRGFGRTLFTADAVDGKPLRTTLDLATQKTAQQALADVGPASALVAIRPSTGELVAVASGPGSKGYNTATVGRYAPGSTFKVVSSLALLRAGVTPTTQVSCTPTTVVDGKTFKNYDDYPASGLGRITFEDALANSCNTAFISQRGKLGPDSLAQAAAALGLGVDHDTGFPSYFGAVGRAGSETQAAASMIGQGTVLASPMAMATVVASVVKGSAVLPTLLPDQEVEQKAPAKPLTGGEAKQLRTMMRAVVERGSGSVLGDLPGGQVIAKTGTAEYGDEPPLPTHAWMVAARDDLAVAVFVEKGDSGSGTAGPILHQFLETAGLP